MAAAPFQLGAPGRARRRRDVEAAVVTVNWSNPHASFVVVTKEGLFWTFESVSIGIFTSHGWTKDALKPGEWAVFH